MAERKDRKQVLLSKTVRRKESGWGCIVDRISTELARRSMNSDKLLKM